jgi:hypothetical protein
VNPDDGRLLVQAQRDAAPSRAYRRNGHRYVVRRFSRTTYNVTRDGITEGVYAATCDQAFTIYLKRHGL